MRCTIVKCVLSLPPRVFCAYCHVAGHTYERSLITKWLTKNNTSPLTNLPLRHKRLTACIAMRDLIATLAPGAHTR